jgi:hypothetical protein
MATPTKPSSHWPRVRAEQEAKENLAAANGRFLKEKEPMKKEEAGRDMIRAIFGKDSITNSGEMSD